jgi:6-phosphogluconolactonase (cycloisomerase 2 family)
MAMAVPVARSVSQFLFTADSGSSTIIASRIHGDGSLSPVAGSPFPLGDAPHKVAALEHSLVAAGTTTLTAYSVDKNSGAIRKTDSLVLGAPSDNSPLDFVVDASTSMLYAVSRQQLLVFRLSKGLFQAVSTATNPISAAAFAKASNTPALDATGRFVYFVNTGASEIIAFHFDGGRLSPLSPPSYPAGQRPLSAAVVVP